MSSAEGVVNPRLRVSRMPLLPPCRICNEKASGFHYGLNTCEACKAFFRRSLHKFQHYQCAEKDDCEIRPGKRSSCAFCRFKKCVALGMCKDAIKTGRYTHEKRAKNITEVKSMDIRESVTIDTYQNEVGEIDHSSSDSNCKCGLYDNDVTAQNPACDLYDKRKTEGYEQIIICIVSVFNTFICSEQLAERMAEKEKEYQEQKALKTNVFGQMDSLSRDEYLVFYNTTGIDIDGRHELIETVIIPACEQSIKQFVRFAKVIPGFVDLCVDDQIALVKATRFDAWTILCSRFCNPEEKLFMTSSGRILHMEDLLKFNKDRDFIESLFALQLKLKRLKLNLEENCILAAFVVMATDHCPLINRAIVEQSQEQLLSCLGYLFIKHHADDRMRFANVINCLLLMRTMREHQHKSEASFARDWNEIISFPPLLCEMWLS